MKNIQSFRIKYENKFANRYCKLGDISQCKRNFCYCRQAAEIWAYIKGIIPDDFGNYTIFNFDGCSSPGKRIISEDATLIAKNIICDFCWGVSWEKIQKKYDDYDSIRDFLNNNSIILNRLKNGNNVVIYGNHNIPSGRTMVASIILKEAIKSRQLFGQRGQTYDWIDFQLLKDILSNNKDSIDLADYRTCNWLVIDNIIATSSYYPKQNVYYAGLIDPFFIERFRNKLPTILVFKFDITAETFDLETRMGLGINTIVNSDRTFKICLNEDNGK